MTEKIAKPANYSTEAEALLIAGYTAGDSIESLATQLGKNTKSIIAKLSRLKLYQKPERLTKSGEKVCSKNEWADAIGKVLPALNENDLESLTKANKRALQVIFEALANSKPLDGNE